MRELPPVLSGDALQQIAALRDYLVRTARGSESETVETVAAHAGGIWKQTGRATGAAALPGGENQSPDALQREARLRALIVKSAEDSRQAHKFCRNIWPALVKVGGWTDEQNE